MMNRKHEIESLNVDQLHAVVGGQNQPAQQAPAPKKKTWKDYLTRAVDIVIPDGINLGPAYYDLPDNPVQDYRNSQQAQQAQQAQPQQ